MKKPASLLLSIFYFSLFSASTLAENEFTFNVPVSIENINFRQVEIHCKVLKGSQVLGRAQRNYSTSNNLSITASIPVSVANPTEANRYACYAVVRLAGSNAVLSGDSNSNSFNNTYRQATGENLSRAIALVNGSL